MRLEHEIVVNRTRHPFVIARGGSSEWRTVMVRASTSMTDAMNFEESHFEAMQARMDGLKSLYDEWGALVILVKGLTPIPFKLVTIASGFFQFNFFLFVILSAITRGARFFAIAWLLKRYGAPMQEFIEKRLTLIGWTFLVLLVGGFALVALL